MVCSRTNPSGYEELNVLDSGVTVQFTASELRDRIQKQVGFSGHEEIEDARINARLNALAEYEDRDDGRSDGYGESYAERNL